MWSRAVLAGLTVLVAGCASAPPARDAGRVSPPELLAARPLAAAAPTETAAPVDETEVLAVSPEMRAFVAEHVARGATRPMKLLQLTSALIDVPGFRLTYDETTRTAAATFKARRGNCLSFSNMFVALARQAGLQAWFQEVDAPPDWSFRDDAFVLNRHINVLVDLGRAGERVVDFNVDDFKASYDRRVITDERALAHYYNNVAVERLRAGDGASALACLRKALAHDTEFSPAWTTLGTLYRRGGQGGHAEGAYLRALDADGADTVAMSNLSWLYEHEGDAGRAAWYRHRVLAHRNRNPYYHFQLGKEAFDKGEYDAAIAHVERAARTKRNEDQFYFLLSLAYRQKGDTRTAARYLARAQRVAATDELRRRYESKMQALGQRPKDAVQPQ